MLNLDNVGSA